MEAIPLWQVVSLSSILSWVFISSLLQLTQKIRSLIQPSITRHVHRSTPFILQTQRFRHGLLDAFFSALSCVVSVPFYTAFLPILFWSGHSKLARQMTLLMAFCDYLGNSVKDLASAPRPSSPPVRRVTATKDEKENAMEYGLPSSHSLNTVCFSGYTLIYVALFTSILPPSISWAVKKICLCGFFSYLLHYVLTNNHERNGALVLVGITMVCLTVVLIGLGRIYLGMHSLVDIVGGIIMGLMILLFWILVNEYIDNFIVSGQNVTSFWACLSFILLFAYPTPELPTPSFEYHAAFDGVAFGIVSGVQQTYLQFHHEGVPRIFSEQLPLPVFIGRVLVGIPTILIVKFCSKALAKWTLPVLCNTVGVPISSSCYIPALKASDNTKTKYENKTSSYLQKIVLSQESYDVDTGIRFLQYAGLAWSVVDLVPSLFAYLRL